MLWSDFSFTTKKAEPLNELIVYTLFCNKMNELIQSGFGIIIFILVWLYTTKRYIPDKIKEQCETGVDKSSSIFWGTIGYTLLFELIGGAILFGLSMTGL